MTENPELSRNTPDLNVLACDPKTCEIPPPNSQPFSRTDGFPSGTFLVAVLYFFIFANTWGTNFANGHYIRGGVLWKEGYLKK